MTGAFQRRLMVLAVLLAGLLTPLVSVAQQGIKPDDIRLELTLEPRIHPPHPGEMILLSILGTYKIPVVREKLRQPELDGFDWMQLGEDRWFKAFEDGFEVVKFERRMALFPQTTGELVVPAFVHELEMLSRRRQTLKITRASDTVTVTSAPRTGGDAWWFPVRHIEIQDRWSNAPEALDAGGAALRIVTLTIEGTAPQRIPPMPELTGAGAFIFAHPENRIVSLGPAGPITRVFWRWTIRPMEGSAGYVNPIEIRYFDTATRQSKAIKLSAQRVAYAGGPQQVAKPAGADGGASSTPTRSSEQQLAKDAGTQFPGWSIIAGLILGAGLILFVLVATSGRRMLAFRSIWQAEAGTRALRQAAKRRDPRAVRRHAHTVLARANADPPAMLGDLDRALYGPGTSSTPMPDSRAVARAVLARLMR